MIATRELQSLRGSLQEAVAAIDAFKAKQEAPKIEIPPFHDFVEQTWPIIEPGRPFVGGWHLDAICEHLTAVYNGDIKRLLVNMPPRHGKSSLISVLWSAWLLLKDPAIRLLCASYALNLATRDNLKVRRIIKSPWFQHEFPGIFEIVKDQDAKMKFETDRLGYRMSVSVGSSTTGEGGDILIIDDMHNIDEKESEVKREAAIDWFDNTWCTRLNDAMESAMVVVGQRIHEQDVSGHILETNDGEWVHLNLPAEYDPKKKCVTPVISASNDENAWKGEDPRKTEGELLWPKRFPQEAVEKAKKRHGVLGYSALYGQDPIPPGGFIFNATNERLFTVSPEGDMFLLQTPSGVQPVRAYDCWYLTTSDVAAKDKEINDFTVFSYWAVTPGNDVLLLDVWRGHWSIPKQKEKARQFYQTHYSQAYRAFYWEDVAYQSAISQDLLLEGIPCMEFHPQNKGDKVARAVGASIWQEVGKSYFRQGATWLEDWKNEIYKFPKDAHDDQVDTYSMVCMIVREQPFGALDDETANALQNYVGY